MVFYWVLMIVTIFGLVNYFDILWKRAIDLYEKPALRRASGFVFLLHFSLFLPGFVFPSPVYHDFSFSLLQVLDMGYRPKPPRWGKGGGSLRATWFTWVYFTLVTRKEAWMDGCL